MVSEVTFVIKITLPRTTVDMNIEAPIRALEERRGKEEEKERGINVCIIITIANPKTSGRSPFLRAENAVNTSGAPNYLMILNFIPERVSDYHYHFQ